MSTTEQITEAIIRHGAKAVYDAASARMSGYHKYLAVVGLHAETIGDANRIMTTAFSQMGAADRAADLTDVSIKLAKI